MSIVLDSVSKIFRHNPAVFNWFGNERCGKTHALRDVSLQVDSGQILVLLGPNGSGKSTTLKLLSTLLLPDSGRVLIDGLDTRKHSDMVRSRVGFAVASERSFFPRLSARENLEFFASLDDVPARRRSMRISALLVSTGLRDAADTLVMKFSSGMYQRLAIARALLKSPSIVLLDEPARSLDPAAAAETDEMILGLAAQGTTVVLATHSFTEAAALNATVIILFGGRVAAKIEGSKHDVSDLRDFYFEVTGESGRIELLPQTVA